MTGEDLGLKPNTIEKAKFEYFPLGEVFNEGLEEEGKKTGTFEETKKYWR